MAQNNPESLGEQQQVTPAASSSPSSFMKTYNMFYTFSRLNVTLHLNSTKDTPPLYYGESVVMTTHPNIRLRSGPSNSSPIVACARLNYVSRHILLNHNGDSSVPESEIVWEELRRDKLRLLRGGYEFDTALGGTKGERRTYGWKVDKSIVKTIYRCVDQEGRNVANMFSGGFVNWKKGGEIEVLEGLDKGLEEMLIVSALGIWAAEAGWSCFQGYKKGGKPETAAAHN